MPTDAMYPQPQQPQPHYAPVIVVTLAPITATNAPPTSPAPALTNGTYRGAYYKRLYDTEICSLQLSNDAERSTEKGKQVTARVWTKLEVESGD